jgi:uncharacterized surface protein with fasciclin (FAS1) repeats
MSDLSILQELLELAGLDERLNEFDVLTLAAPTNSAFEALAGDVTLTFLREPTNKDHLIRILRYHLITDF